MSDLTVSFPALAAASAASALIVRAPEFDPNGPTLGAPAPPHGELPPLSAAGRYRQ